MELAMLTHCLGDFASQNSMAMYELDGKNAPGSNDTPVTEGAQELVEVVTDEATAPWNWELWREGNGPTGSGGAGEVDVAIAVSLDGVEAAALFEIVEQFSDEGIQQTEATPLAVAAVAGLVGGVARGEVVPGGIVGELPKDGIEDGAVVEGRAAAQVRRGRG